MPWLATQGSALWSVLFAAAFLWLSLAIGRFVLLLIGPVRGGTRIERGVVAVALGAAALEYVPFALGAVGALSTRSVQIAMVVVVLAVAKQLWIVARAVGRECSQWMHRSRDEVLWVVALLPAVLVAGLLALTPTIDPDGLAYHLTVPKRWLGEGYLGYLPTYPYSNAPMGVEMLFTIALSIAGDVAAKMVHFTLGTLGLVGLYVAGTRLRGPVAGGVAAALYFVGPTAVCTVLGCAYVEGAAAFAMIAAAVAWILWLQSSDRAWLRCAALLSGAAVTFKITAALLPAALFALTWVAEADPARAKSERRLGAALRSSLSLLPFMLGPILPWMTRSAIVTGNPFFPLFARIIPSRDFSPDESMKFDRFNRYMTWGNAFGRDWTIQQRTWILAAACAAVFATGLVVAARSRSWMGRGTVLVVSVVVVAQLSATGFYLRYWIPLAAVLTLPAVAALYPWLKWRLAPAACVGVTLVASLAQARRCLAQAEVGVGELARVVLGMESNRTFLLRNVTLYPLYEQVNHDLPANAGVMLSCYCGGFYIDRATFCAEMVQDSLGFASWKQFTADVRHLGITHVIAPSALATGGPLPPFDLSSTSSIIREGEYQVMRPLLSGHGSLRGVASDEGLYELDDALLREHEP